METMQTIPRIYTAIAEWSACLIFIILLPKRLEKLKVVAACGLALLIQSIFLTSTTNVSIYLWIPCMLFAFLMMQQFIYRCCKISYIEGFYFTIQAFVIAEFTASFEWQISLFFYENDIHMLQMALFIGTYSCVNVIIFFLFRRYLPQDRQLDLDKKDLRTALIIGIAIFAVSNLSFITKNTPFSGQYVPEVAKIRTLVDLAGIAMLYAHLVQCYEMKVRRELDAVENVLQNQYKQYKQSRESIDLINYKYHDLKHQIAVLRSEEDPEKRNSFLNKMEEEIKMYELQNKTGNTVLDTVLTSKSMYCDKHGITLTSVADGKLLDFMDTMDICSIFGNALDNAIECELKIEDKEKRLIHVVVTQQKNFLLIRIENYFEGNLKMKEGKLLTTKKEKKFHGYGIKSIRYTVNKYGGVVNIDVKDNWFELKMLIPIK